MIQATLITLREGLEAALIIGIILAYLSRVKADHQRSIVWRAVVAAIGTSFLAGAIIFGTVGEFSGSGEKIYEGAAMVVAASLLTWMIFWMRGKAGTIRSELEEGVANALERQSSWALAALAFVAVVREGVETAIFLFAASREAEAVGMFVGAGIGLTVAIILGYGLYRGIKTLDLRRVFQATGLLLIFFAGGILAHGIHEFQEVGLIPVLVSEVWNTNHILNDKGTAGSLFRAAFGYNGNPTLVEAAAYFGYIIPSAIYFFRNEDAHQRGTDELGESSTSPISAP